LQLVYVLVDAERKKGHSVIYIGPYLESIFKYNFCTKYELKNLIKNDLEPIEHFELDLFDPTEHCRIPHPSFLNQSWNIEYMLQFPSNRLALTTLLLSKKTYSLHPSLRERIERNERQTNPNFVLVPTSAENILNLTIRLILDNHYTFLDQDNILVLVPPFTWYLCIVSADPMEVNYVHISNFPSKIVALLTEV
jgi:hypothetical protein